jgi:putative nucleotidyltransferase with HDIG domain
LGTGGGYRDFKVQSDYKMPIEDDLSRRDFTINALALNIKDNTIIDPFSGLSDLKKKTIRTVGEPKKRFREDYSRMLRALRFACQLNFKINTATFKEIRNLIPHINDERMAENGNKQRVVPFETIARELLKAFYQDPIQAFDLFEKSGAFRELMPEVLSMKGCPQPKLYHTEGDVYKHTKLSLENLNSRRFKRQFHKDKSVNAELALATLFHDIGKPVTIKTPEKDKVDRIRFNEHDVEGAKITVRICKRLKLDSQPQGSPLRIDIEDMYWLVAKHLILVHGNVNKMRAATIEKYFFNPLRPGDNLLKLIFTDSVSTIPKSGAPDMTNFHNLTRRIRELEKLSAKRKKLPQRILSGREIMRKFNLKPSPEVGELLSVLREAQLKGKVGKEKKYSIRKKKAYKILERYLKNK